MKKNELLQKEGSAIELATRVANALEKEFAGETISWSALDKIRIPAGGGTVWSLHHNKELIATPTFEAIIAYNRGFRSYWEGAFTGENKPPDCQSFDMLTGTSGRVCAQCPFARFGTAPTGKGQACKQLRLLALIFEEKIFPSILILPPTSLNNFLRYRLSLVECGLTSDKVITRFSLVPARSGQGIAYSQVAFEKVREANFDFSALQKIFANLRIEITQEDIAMEETK